MQKLIEKELWNSSFTFSSKPTTESNFGQLSIKKRDSRVDIKSKKPR